MGNSKLFSLLYTYIPIVQIVKMYCIFSVQTNLPIHQIEVFHHIITNSNRRSSLNVVFILSLLVMLSVRVSCFLTILNKAGYTFLSMLLDFNIGKSHSV